MKKSFAQKELEILLSEDKFSADEDLNYPGTDTGEIKEILQTGLDNMITELLDNIEKCEDHSYIISVFENYLLDKNTLDTDDCDRIALYLEDIINIFDLEGAEDLLDSLRY